MKGLRGKLSPNIDEITALGIEARNDAERRHYAERWVKQECVRILIARKFIVYEQTATDINEFY